MKKIVIVLFCACLGTFVNAQTAVETKNSVNISACAKGAGNRVARLYIEDAITKLQHKVDEQPIDKKGCFTLRCELSETRKAFIKIDFYQTYIYLQPGEKYTLIFDPFDFHTDEKINPQILDRYLSYRFEKPDSNELNQLIWRFETMHDNFLAENYARMSISRESYATFKQQVGRTFSYSGHQYFNNYKAYALADMERIFNLTTPASLYFAYIHNKPILYENTAFADFITQYYQNYFPSQVRYDQNIFINQINQANNLPAILDSLGRDTTLQNEKLREFVLLVGLRKMYYNYEFRKASVIKLLKQIQDETKFHEHSLLAGSILQSVKRMEKGVSTILPKFLDPTEKTLFDFSKSDKFKYVMFVNGLCQSCDAEIKSLEAVAEKLYDSVDFIVVNCDYEINRCLRNKPETLQNITYLYFNKDFETLENLGITDYPIVVFFDPKNVVLSYYFQLPGQRVERAIRPYLRSEKPLSEE